jgi:hypothetical protein
MLVYNRLSSFKIRPLTDNVIDKLAHKYLFRYIHVEEVKDTKFS